MSIHNIVPSDLEAFCDNEGEPEQFKTLDKLWENVQKSNLSTMKEIEALVVEETVQRL